MGKGQLLGLPNWIKNKITNLATLINQNTTDIDSLKSRVGVNETSITELNSDLATTNNKLNKIGMTKAAFDGGTVASDKKKCSITFNVDTAGLYIIESRFRPIRSLTEPSYCGVYTIDQSSGDFYDGAIVSSYQWFSSTRLMQLTKGTHTINYHCDAEVNGCTIRGGATLIK